MKSRLHCTVAVIKKFPLRLRWTPFTFAFHCVYVEETFVQRFFCVPLRYYSVSFPLAYCCVSVPMRLCSVALAYHCISFPLRLHSFAFEIVFSNCFLRCSSSVLRAFIVRSSSVLEAFTVRTPCVQCQFCICVERKRNGNFSMTATVSIHYFLFTRVASKHVFGSIYFEVHFSGGGGSRYILIFYL